MIFVDYPPGGLGHFIAQLFTDTISYQTTSLEYHFTPIKNYDDELVTTSEEIFLSRLRTWKPAFEVSIGHSFGHLDKISFPGKIYQVIVRSDVLTYILTQQIKTGAYKSEQHKQYILDNFKEVSNRTIRENYALQYNYLKNTETYVNTKSSNADFVINFDNFYDNKKSFTDEVLKINPKLDVEKVYEHFLRTQGLIFERKKLYSTIIFNVQNNISQDLNSLSILDQGLLSGMLNEIYPFKEWQLPMNNEWFKNTDQIHEELVRLERLELPTSGT